MVNDTYYKGFEGEPEIQLIYNQQDKTTYTMRMWEGYFNNIMYAIEAEKKGWTELAYYFNMQEGWYEESPWKVPNINQVIEQLGKIDKKQLDETTIQILEDMIRIFISAEETNNEVYIAYE